MKTTETTAACTTTTRGMLLPCPCCGGDEVGITLNLAADPATEDCFQCVECQAEFGTAFLKDFMAKWTKVLAWVELMPGQDDD